MILSDILSRFWYWVTYFFGNLWVKFNRKLIRNWVTQIKFVFRLLNWILNSSNIFELKIHFFFKKWKINITWLKPVFNWKLVMIDLILLILMISLLISYIWHWVNRKLVNNKVTFHSKIIFDIKFENWFHLTFDTKINC